MTARGEDADIHPQPSGKRRVAVLMGGTSAERAISLRTGEQVMAALDPHRYDVVPVDARGLKALAGAPVESAPETVNGVPLATMWDRRPDVVFIALHGPGGEDGSVQGLLDVLGIPYTGSGVLASALAMDKAMCKRVLRAEGIPTPWSVTLAATDIPALDAMNVPLPLVVKPNRQGSSFGMTIVRDRGALNEAVRLALEYDDACLLEEWATGTEITVAALGNRCPRVLPSIEIIPKAEFYDYASKYEDGGSRHIIPARISPRALATAEDVALRCHTVLGCRGMSRTDMMVDGDAVTVLEVNTIPGMTRTSLLPDAAAAAGIPFPALLDRLIEDALEG